MRNILQKFEKETIIYYNEEADIASVETHNNALEKRMKQLLYKYPNIVTTKSNGIDWPITYYIPIDWIKINPHRKLTEKQRKEKANCMRSVISKTIDNTLVL